MLDFVRGGSRAAVTSKVERFLIIVNGWKPITIITKCSILDVATALDPPLFVIYLVLIVDLCKSELLFYFRQITHLDN